MSSFFGMGFGVGLLFLLPLSLLENAAYSAFIIFRGQRQNSTRALFFGTFIISVISFSIAFALLFREPFVFLYLLPLAIALFWAWYFVLIPQLIIRKLLSSRETQTWPNRYLKMILFRIILTVVLPAALYLIHGILGKEYLPIEARLGRYVFPSI
jgi:hypothetical protein